MATPTLKAVAPTTPEEDLTFAPEPVVIYGMGEGGDAEVDWEDVTGKPTAFPPATHTHTIAQVTGLQDILDDLETRLSAVEA